MCFVYKGSKKEGLYLYLPEKDNFSDVPEPLLESMGNLTMALTFKLTNDRQLGKEDPEEVLNNLKSQGFHLQMPDTIESLLEKHKKSAPKTVD